MSNDANNAIVAKSKAIYGNNLKAQQFIELSEKKSLADFVLTLKNHPQFKESFSGIQEQLIRRNQLETILKKISLQQVIRIMKYAVGKEQPFFYQPIMSLEIDFILSMIRYFFDTSEDKKVPLQDIPVFVIQHSKLPYDDLIKATKFSDFINYLKGTIYESILNPYRLATSDNFPFSLIEGKFYELRYEVIFEHIQHFYTGQTNHNLKKMYQIKIELDNISKIYRLKKFYQATPEMIKPLLMLNYSRIKPSIWDEILAIKDPEKVLTFLRQSSFSTLKGDDEYVYVEYDVERIKFNLAKRYLYYSSNPAEVYAAFLILEEIEQINLTNIIEGIRYNLDSNDIRKILIY
ncbi:MAG: V-type ATPase subunit [Bacilli bacterium]